MTIKVLIVDDSALVRQLLTELLGKAGGIEVVGVAPDPLVAREKIKQLNPDVLTLDIEMPRMDGLSFLEKLMALRPMPVVVVSTLTQRGTDAALHALELGAVDYVAKPLLDIGAGMRALGEELIAKLRAAATARVRARAVGGVRAASITIDRKLSTAGHIVAVGASTGGVEALQDFLTRMPVDAPPILIAQHMPAGFTSAFAQRLDARCKIAVAEASDGIRVAPGQAYIAPGGRHLELSKSGAHYFCRLQDEPAVSGHRPSVDVLFASVAAAAGANATGVILTGMGSDGAHGLLEMRRAGARTLGQDEASCLIYGMPKAAKAMGAVEREMSLARLAVEVLQ